MFQSICNTDEWVSAIPSGGCHGMYLLCHVKERHLSEILFILKSVATKSKKRESLIDTLYKWQLYISI